MYTTLGKEYFMKEKVVFLGCVLWVLILSSCGHPRTSLGEAVKILTTQEGFFTFQVNATSETDWIRVDLDKPGTKNLPEGNPGWDLAFQRVEIKTRRGNLSEENTWYDYDMVSHKVSPVDQTWDISSSEGNIFSLRILNYYDSEGTSGIYTLEVRMR